jgi:hypothetical protein
MKVAVLADIHGNLPALEAVLEDLDEHAPDRIVLLGDIAGGPMPAQTLDRLAELGERAVWVHGNGERELVDTYDKEPPTDGERPKSPQQTASDKKNAGTGLMRRRHRDLIAGLPMTVTLDVDGRTPYDVRAAAARIADSGYPDASAWAEAYVLHTYSDAEALAAFTPLVSQHGTDGPLDG